MTYSISGGNVNAGSIIGSFVGGAIGGVLTFSAAGRGAVAVVSAIGGAAGYVTECVVNHDSVTLDELLYASALGFVSGLIAGDGVLKDSSLTKSSNGYNSLKYNFLNSNQAEAFLGYAANFQKELPGAIGRSIGNGLRGSAVGLLTDKLIDSFR